MDVRIFLDQMEHFLIEIKKCYMGEKNVTNGSEVVQAGYVCACAPKNMDHCEPNRPCHLPDWKIWMIDDRFEVQTKIR